MKRAALLFVGALLVLAGDAGARSPAASKPLRVGLVIEASGNPRDPFAQGSIAGLRRAVRELGVEPKVLRPSLKEGYLPSFEYLARRGFDLVVGGSALEGGAIVRAARTFPGTRFAIIDQSLDPLARRPANLQGVEFASEEGSYLAGYLAARMEQRRTGKDVVSSVGGGKLPQVDRYIAGYRAGARRADPGITTLNTYAGMSFGAGGRSKCRNIALEQIARGSGVVFQIAGGCGLGALEAAKERGVFAIGVDADQSFLGPHVLTSVLKRFDVAVFETIRATRSGRFQGGRTVSLGVRQGAVGLGKMSTRVPRAVVADVERIRRQIVAGTISGISTTVR
jgi:basic membrane protein A